jgi:GLPGLI family protein
MKFKYLVSIFLIFISISSFAQDKKNISSGKIIFEITYPESQLDENTMAAMPSESVMLFKDDKVRVDVSMAMGKTTVISDNKTGNGTMLMDMMGNKIAMKIDKNEIVKQKGIAGKPKVELTNETKSIAGYNCKKAIVTINVNGSDKKFDAWFTNELRIKNSPSSQIEGIDGFLMEFYNNQNGMNMKMTAKSVEAMNVSDDSFIIPDGYQYKTMEELKSMGRGGR